MTRSSVARYVGAAIRPAAVRILFLSLIGISVALECGSGTTAFGAERDANAALVRSAVDEKIANLNLPERRDRSLAEKAIRIRQLIARGTYPAAQTLITDLLSQSEIQGWRYYPLSDVMGAVSDVYDPAYKLKLDVWVTVDGTNPIPLLLRAQYYYDAGWSARGHGFARETEPDKLQTFTDYMQKGLADTDAAMRLDDRNPYVFYLRLRLLRGFGLLPKLQQGFEEAALAIPATTRCTM